MGKYRVLTATSVESLNQRGQWRYISAFVNNEQNRWIVCENFWGGRNIADCGVAYDKTEPIAQLISAAPELLDKLDELSNEVFCSCCSLADEPEEYGILINEQFRNELYKLRDLAASCQEIIDRATGDTKDV